MPELTLHPRAWNDCLWSFPHPGPPHEGEGEVAAQMDEVFLLLFVHKKKIFAFFPYPAIRMILPGFMMFFGSSACFTAFMAAISTGEE